MRASTPRWPNSRRSARPTSGATRRPLRAACGQFAPGATIPDCIARMGADKPVGGPVAEARRQLPQLPPIPDRPRHRPPSPAPSRPRSRNRRPTTGRIRPISISPDPMRPACPASITSPRPIRTGTRRRAPPISRASRTCCSPRSTKSGRAIFSTSSIPTVPIRSSASCSSAMPLPRAGRITARR